MTVQLAPHVNLQNLLPADAKRRRLSPGETLLAPGEHPKTIWFIAQGSVRSLAALPPQNQWRTIERHGTGQLIGWLGWIHQRSIEHLRAAEDCELIELELHEIEALWSNSQEFKNWIAAQRPTIELIHLLLQLSHGNPARSHQLDNWKRLTSRVAAAIIHNTSNKCLVE